MVWDHIWLAGVVTDTNRYRSAAAQDRRVETSTNSTWNVIYFGRPTQSNPCHPHLKDTSRHHHSTDFARTHTPPNTIHRPSLLFFNPYLLVLTSYCHDGIGSGSGGPPPPPGPPAPAAPVATPFQTFTPQQPLSGGMGGPPPPPGPPAVGGGMGGPPPPPGQPRVMQVSTGTNT